MDEYVRVFKQPGGARAAFAYYRAALSEDGLALNRDRATRKLAMPVLTLAGQYGVGDLLLNTMKPVADNVHGVLIPDVGHYILEECPVEAIDALLSFFQSE
jgi:pimeloyl-ACP methyl ester carboxylesterase